MTGTGIRQSLLVVVYKKKETVSGWIFLRVNDGRKN